MNPIEEKPLQFQKFKKKANIRNSICLGTKKGTARNRLLLCEKVSKRQARILADTEFSKGQNIPGAFTAVEEIDKFMESCIESKEKKMKECTVRCVSIA